jgi:hypothetical protein
MTAAHDCCLPKSAVPFTCAGLVGGYPFDVSAAVSARERVRRGPPSYSQPQMQAVVDKMDELIHKARR